jgi:hypothetical protein
LITRTYIQVLLGNKTGVREDGGGFSHSPFRALQLCGFVGSCCNNGRICNTHGRDEKPEGMRLALGKNGNFKMYRPINRFFFLVVTEMKHKFRNSALTARLYA